MKTSLRTRGEEEGSKKTNLRLRRKKKDEGRQKPHDEEKKEEWKRTSLKARKMGGEGLT